ncbi:MAG: hypothetical protein LBS11_01260 [Oscillospiraceae bacterium]|jgi:hypothetical protein|nr:hypothetical protein [Oscillospiraceae bacterium]
MRTSSDQGILAATAPERASFFRRVAIPVICAAALCAVCVLVAGAYFIEIEDHYANMLFGGGYGAYDSLAANIHPLLGGLIVRLYGLWPGVNWFGSLALALLFLSGAGAFSLAARRRGGLLPGLFALSPILVVMVCLTQSRVTAAMCAITGALLVMDALHGPRGAPRFLLGALLLAAGSMLSYRTGWVFALLTVACVGAGKSFPARGARFWIAAPVIAALACGAAFSANLDSGWRVFNEQYIAYDDASTSFLRGEVETLLNDYGMTINLEGQTNQPDNELPEGVPTQEEAVERSSLGKVGWSLNDGHLFILRSAADAELTSPQAVRDIQRAAPWFSLDGFVERLWETVSKYQFLMVIGLFLLCALVVEITNRSRGWITLLSAVAAFGGHALMLLINRASFRDIAPFYLLGILALASDFDPKASAESIRRVLRSKLPRRAAACVMALGLAGVICALLVTIGQYNRAQSPSLAAAEELADLMDHLPDAVFIGDNPLDRFNTNALTPPRKDAFARLIGGSYDLYSPRRDELMARFNLENPLKDAIDRTDVVYVDMSGSALIASASRLYTAYGIPLKTATPSDSAGVRLLSMNAAHRMQLYWLQSDIPTEPPEAAQNPESP